MTFSRPTLFYGSESRTTGTDDRCLVSAEMHFMWTAGPFRPQKKLRNQNYKLRKQQNI